MNAWEWAVAIVGGLLALYAAARLMGAGWYRSRREHLREVSQMFNGKPKRIPLKKPGEDNGV